MYQLIDLKLSFGVGFFVGLAVSFLMIFGMEIANELKKRRKQKNKEFPCPKCNTKKRGRPKKEFVKRYIFNFDIFKDEEKSEARKIYDGDK